MLDDLITLSNDAVYGLIGKSTVHVKDIASGARTSEEAIAIYFNLLSHFTADASMPCHCDARPISRTGKKGIHDEIEKYWGKLVGESFTDNAIIAANPSVADLCIAAADVDAWAKLSFATKVPNLRAKDVWVEVMNICRGSFAMANILIPGTNPDAKNMEQKIIKDPASILPEMTSALLHDAVLNTAIVWKYIWKEATN
jgi:hypothetical protein